MKVPISAQSKSTPPAPKRACRGPSARFACACGAIGSVDLHDRRRHLRRGLAFHHRLRAAHLRARGVEIEFASARAVDADLRRGDAELARGEVDLRLAALDGDA